MNTHKKEWLERIQAIAKRKGGICLSTQYVNAFTKLKFKCARGHLFSTRPSNTLRGIWCAECAVIEQHRAQRKPYSEIIKLVSNRNGTLLSSEKAYQNKTSRLEVRCESGHQFVTTGDRLTIGNWCARCGRKSAAQKLLINISVPRTLAENRGGKLLSQEYKGNSKNLLWKCFAGHEFKATYSNVRKGQWCPHCSRIISISESVVRTYCEKLMGISMPSTWPEWLVNKEGNRLELDGYNIEHRCAFEHHGTQHYRETKFYKGSKFTKRVRDDRLKEKICNEHQVKLLIVNQLFLETDLEDLRRIIISFAKQHSLPLVSNAETVVIDIDSIYLVNPLDRFKELCKERGGKCLSTKYIGYKSKIEVMCSRGHTWHTAPNHLISGRWCPICMWTTIKEKNTKHTINEMHEVAKKRGGQCLSKSYNNSETHLEWQCAEGHRWKAKPNNIMNGKWCRLCAIRRNADRQRGNIEECRAEAQSRGGSCLSENYVNARTKMNWRCALGHEWSTAFDSVKNGKWCRICSQKNRRRVKNTFDLTKN